MSNILKSTIQHQKTGKQLKLLKDLPKAYGGDLLTKRAARQSGRPLATKQTMHFVLRSSQARGAWSFQRHRAQTQAIIERFAKKFGVRLNSMAIVGNHIHLHLQLTNRHAYKGFIRAISAAIMMQVTGASRWKKVNLKTKFWDRRPFSRVIIGFRGLLNMNDYIAVNRLEGFGYRREQARFYVEWERNAVCDSG